MSHVTCTVLANRIIGKVMTPDLISKVRTHRGGIKIVGKVMTPDPVSKVRTPTPYTKTFSSTPGLVTLVTDHGHPGEGGVQGG